MKKILEFYIFTILVVLFSSYGCNVPLTPDTEINKGKRFYYYQGEKIFITMIDTLINVNYVDNATFNQVRGLNQKFNLPSTFDSTKFFPDTLRQNNYIFILPKGSKIDNYLTLYGLESVKTYGNESLVRYATPSFELNGNVISLRDEFIASFYPASAMEDSIYLMNQKYSVEIVYKFQPVKESLMYLLRVTKASPFDALDMANIYNESSFTKYAVPNFGSGFTTN